MKQPIQILIVDDSQADAELVVAQLTRDGFAPSYERVDTAAVLNRALEKHPWDIALCDYLMPGFSGVAALRLIREKSPDTPCIIISGTIGEETAVAAMKAGANDYIMKDKLRRLAPAIQREVREAQDRIEKRRIQDTLRSREEELRSVKELERAKDEFIGFVSHELKTPLTVIIGALHTVLTHNELLSEKDRLALIEDSLTEAGSLNDMIENMLYLARAQANKLQTTQETVAPSAIITDILDRFKSRDTVHRFISECPQSARVTADPLKLKIILNNLVSNAVKYSPSGEVRISVTSNSDEAIFAVRDQGRGISEEDQKKLFQPFERLAMSGSQTKGIGLGLLVCQHLVEAQGGRIRVESQSGEGTTVYFTLRAADAKTT